MGLKPLLSQQTPKLSDFGQMKSIFHSHKAFGTVLSVTSLFSVHSCSSHFWLMIRLNYDVILVCCCFSNCFVSYTIRAFHISVAEDKCFRSLWIWPSPSKHENPKNANESYLLRGVQPKSVFGCENLASQQVQQSLQLTAHAQP